MKKFFLLSVSLLFGWILSAQDIITMNDGTDIQAKVTEVGQSEVKYKKFSNPDGPVYSISISDILMITYANGEREMYNNKKTSIQKEPDYKAAFPRGMMTYNMWSGNISVGGETIPHEMEEMYFNPDDYALFKSGKSLSTIGAIIEIAGAFPFGYGVGGLAYGNDSQANVYMAIGGGIAFFGGLILTVIGESRRKTAISHYNSSLAFQPKFYVGGTPNGVGFALAF